MKRGRTRRFSDWRGVGGGDEPTGLPGNGNYEGRLACTAGKAWCGVALCWCWPWHRWARLSSLIRCSEIVERRHMARSPKSPGHRSPSRPTAGRNCSRSTKFRRSHSKGSRENCATHAKRSSKDSWNRATSDLEKISTDDITRPEILQDIEYYKAYCEGRLALVGGGDKAARLCRAMRAFEVNPANQNSYHYFAAMELLGDLAVALSSYDNGIRLLRQAGRGTLARLPMRATVLQANHDGHGWQVLRRS